MKIIAHIPARGGSKRVPRKNLREINGKPMIAYIIEAARNVDGIDELYVNTDDDDILSIGQKYGALPYKRDVNLANDTATSDEFNFDIIQKLKPDVLVMLNPVCPLITTEDISLAIKEFQKQGCDTLITSSKTKMQVFVEDEPVNISTAEMLRPTQENPEVHTLNWAITIWDASKFSKRFKEVGYASLGENRFLYHIDQYKAVKVSYEEDFDLVSRLLK